MKNNSAPFVDVQEIVTGKILLLLSCFQRNEQETLKSTDFFLKKKKEQYFGDFEKTARILLFIEEVNN